MAKARENALIDVAVLAFGWKLPFPWLLRYLSFGNPGWSVRSTHAIRTPVSQVAGERPTQMAIGAHLLCDTNTRESKKEKSAPAPSHIRTSTGAPSRGEILDAARAHGARGRFGEGDFLAFLGFWAVASVAIARAWFWWAVASRVPHRIVESCSRGALRFSAIPCDSAWDETSTLLRPRSDLLR